MVLLSGIESRAWQLFRLFVSSHMLTSAEITCFAAGLALVPLIKLLLFSCSSLYNDDRDVLAMNASLPSTRWFNLGFWRPG